LPSCYLVREVIKRKSRSKKYDPTELSLIIREADSTIAWFVESLRLCRVFVKNDEICLLHEVMPFSPTHRLPVVYVKMEKKKEKEEFTVPESPPRKK